MVRLVDAIERPPFGVGVETREQISSQTHWLFADGESYL
jgi:hypothetical protein